MPRVPTVIPRRAIPVAPGVRQSAAGASAAAFGAGTGRALQQLGQVGINAANALEKREQEDIAEQRVARAQEAYNNYRRDAAALLRDPETGLLFKNGKDAAGGTEFFQKQSEALRAKYSADLDESERRLFDRAHTSFSRPAISSLQTHEANQAQVYKQTQNQDLFDGAQADAAETDDPEARLAAEARMLGALQISARLSGRDATQEDGSPSEFVKKKMLLATTKIYQDVITRHIIHEDIEGASRILEANRDKIEPSEANRLEAKLKGQKLAVKTQGIAQQLFAKHGREGEFKALREAQRKYSGKTEDEAVQRISLMYADSRREKTARDKSVLDSYESQINGTDSAADAWAIANKAPLDLQDNLRAFALSKVGGDTAFLGVQRQSQFERVSGAILNPALSLAEMDELVTPRNIPDPVVRRRAASLVSEQRNIRINADTFKDAQAYSNWLGEASQTQDPATAKKMIGKYISDPEDALKAQAAVTTKLFPVVAPKQSSTTVVANHDIEQQIEDDWELFPEERRYQEGTDTLSAEISKAGLTFPQRTALLKKWREGPDPAEDKITLGQINTMVKDNGGEPSEFKGLAEVVRKQLQGRKATPKLVEEIVENQMMTGAIPVVGTFWDGKAPATRFSAGQAGQLPVFTPQVRTASNLYTPEARRAKDEIEALTKSGESTFSGIDSVTDDMIESYMRQRDVGETTSESLLQAITTTPGEFFGAFGAREE